MFQETTLLKRMKNVDANYFLIQDKKKNQYLYAL